MGSNLHYCTSEFSFLSAVCNLVLNDTFNSASIFQNYCMPAYMCHVSTCGGHTYNHVFIFVMCLHICRWALLQPYLCVVCVICGCCISFVTVRQICIHIYVHGLSKSVSSSGSSIIWMVNLNEPIVWQLS